MWKIDLFSCTVSSLTLSPQTLDQSVFHGTIAEMPASTVFHGIQIFFNFFHEMGDGLKSLSRLSYNISTTQKNFVACKKRLYLLSLN